MTTVAFFGGCEPGCFHYIVDYLWLKVVDPTLILNEKTIKKLDWSTSKLARFACVRVGLVNFWSGVRSSGTDLAETLTFLIYCTECSLQQMRDDNSIG